MRLQGGDSNTNNNNTCCGGIITLAELKANGWIALHGNVYDLTNYANRHPGGARVITRLNGTDGTAEYRKFHSAGLLGSLRNGELIGPFEGGSQNTGADTGLKWDDDDESMEESMESEESND